jgi:hypothetical protein
VGISDSSRPPTRAPLAEGRRPLPLVSIKSATAATAEVGGALGGQARASAAAAACCAVASGLGCLDGDEDRAADSECGRHVGSCRRDWVGDSNPLTPIIDFGHLVISAGPTAQFPPQFGR